MTDQNSDPKNQLVPIIPQVITLQPQTTIPNEILQAISGVSPQQALEKVDSWVQLDYRDRDKERSHQIELAKIAQATEQLKETNRASERKSEQTTAQKNLRWGLGVFFAIFVSSMAYGYLKNDNEIPKTIITVGAGLLGGAGLKESLNQSKKSEKEDSGK